MVNLTEVKEIAEESDIGRVQKLLDEGWVLLSVAGGKDVDGFPCNLYSLGLVQPK